MRAYFLSVSANRWLAVRLEFIGTFIVLFCAFFVCLDRGSLDPALGGLALSYALTVTQSINWTVRMTSQLETSVVSVERIKQYGDTPPEAPERLGELPVALTTAAVAVAGGGGKKRVGALVFQGVKMRYRPGLPLVLKGLDVEIVAGEKIGVVGRTGAGKSSLILAILRLVEPCGGRILLDGVDTKKLGLHDLRRLFAVIPQDPVLFTGTIRANLDPFSTVSEAMLWEALETVNMAAHVRAMDGGLDAAVSEGGKNLSFGQRQMLCVARAKLKDCRVLLMDEATSGIDVVTDRLVHSTLHKAFKDHTIVTIAHRLETIMQSDRILVMDDGAAKELAPPQQLLQDPASLFAKLAEAMERSSE